MVKNLASISKTLPKTNRVFDTSKVTDHHAIIPTGQVPTGLTDVEKKVYDLIARRFIAVFYPDCKFSTTTVMGKVDKVEFKASGKEILSQGWRAVYGKDEITDSSAKNAAADKILPSFVKGETGPHKPTLTEKMTVPPKHYTEASLLRAMETAGKLVDDEQLSAAMKENGIGRPSSRAGIIETLFKRHYIRREKKNLVATPTGIQLIDTIHDKLLTSVELTGIWQKKLREIEQDKYDAATFINELKAQVARIVSDVMHDSSGQLIVYGDDDKPRGKAKKSAEKTTTKSASKSTTKSTRKTKTIKVGDVCPKCKQGHVIKGNTAYGCSRWKEGCDFRAPLK